MRSGKPCFIGTRIAVYDVLDYLASGMTTGKIVRDFPELTEATCEPRSASRRCGSAPRHARVKLLFDQDLSHLLVRQLPGEFPESRHVTDVRLDTAPPRRGSG